MKSLQTLLLALLIIGCARADPKTIWESPDSSIEDKLSAAKTLLPSNATLPEIRIILGKPDRWFRIHGPVVSLGNDTNVPAYIDDRGVQYQFGDCYINVYCSEYNKDEASVLYLNRIEVSKPEVISTNMEIDIQIK